VTRSRDTAGAGRRRVLQGAAAAAALPLLPASAQQPAEQQRKVLRLLFNAAETTLDPARISDNYSRSLTMHIFEALYTYDYLARPIRARPLTAVGMPEVSSDFRVWTVRSKASDANWWRRTSSTRSSVLSIRPTSARSSRARST
jgi:ABC-type oligopeptide transport system substrate-binding subunit